MLETYFQDLLEAIPIPIVIYDRNFQYVFVNIYYYKEFKIKGSIIGKTFHEVWPNSGSRQIERYQNLLRDKLPMGPIEDSCQLTSGEVVWYRDRYTPLIKDDEVEYIFVVTENITKRKESEKDLQQINEDLEQYLWMISHDLRAPIRNVAYLANDIAQQFSAAQRKEFDEPLNLLNSNAEKIIKRFEAILHHAALSKNTHLIETFNLETLLRLLISRHTTQHPQQNSQFQLSLHNKEIKGVPFFYETIFENLISNALKHAAHPNLKIEICSCIKNGDYVFCVQDNGPGVPKMYHNSIFSPFKKTPKTLGTFGAGVGLSLVAKAIKKMGGELKILPPTPEMSGFGVKFSIPVPNGKHI